MRSTLIDRTRNAPAVGHQFVRGVLADFPEVADDAALVVSELLTNAVVHGGANDAPLAVSVEAGEERVRIRVGSDSADEFRIAPKRRNAPGGFGLSIISSLAAQWGFRRRPISEVWCDLPLVRC